MFSIDSLIDMMQKPTPVNPGILEGRLKEEFKVFHRTGLDEYFMMFHSLLVWAQEQHIPLYVDSLDGEGSLVLHCLGINCRNPLEYGFGFESFLNMERLAIPWFGIICRPEDIQRVYDYLAMLCFKDMLPGFPCGMAIGLQDKLGGIRFFSKDGPLDFPLSDLERHGFVPVFLEGNTALSKLSIFEESIKAMIPENDGDTFEMLSDGDSDDVYLLDDPYMIKCLRTFKPSCLDELHMLMMLFHNGLSDMIAKLDFISDDIVTCKEQFFDMLQWFAGFSVLDTCRFWRAAIERKDLQLISDFRVQFFSGALKMGRDKRVAEHYLNMIDVFSGNPGYKRNIGSWHVLLAYRLAYLKCNFGDEIQFNRKR